jgi:hypothetical protein
MHDACSKQSCLLPTGVFLGFIFSPEYGGDMIWYTSCLSADCVGLYPRKQNSSTYSRLFILWDQIISSALRFQTSLICIFSDMVTDQTAINSPDTGRPVAHQNCSHVGVHLQYTQSQSQ